MEFQWNDKDPETGERRFLHAKRFAKVWSFRSKPKRRGDWTEGLTPTLAMWEEILDIMERRYRRREGVEQEDIDEVAKIIKGLRHREDLIRAEEEVMGRSEEADKKSSH